MRSVRSATCTSGEPVSLPERWYCLTTCAFCGTCNAIRLSLFRESLRIFRAGDFNRAPRRSQGFSMFISRLSKPQGAQLAFALRAPEPDQRAVGAIERAQSGLQSADYQRLAVAQAGLGGGVELGRRKVGEQSGERQQALPGRRHGAQRFERDCVGDAEAARGDPAQRREMRAGAERGTNVLAERADIRAFAAADAQLGQRRAVGEQLELGNLHATRSALHRAALARELVE